jgi:hypothetical protein
MEGPIYKFARIRFIEAWYQLSQSERDKLLAKLEELKKQFGVTTGPVCDISWSNERWSAFVVEVFPDMASVQKYNAGLVEVDWFRYVDVETILGTAWK